MAAAYETIVFHDAPAERLRLLVEAVCAGIRDQHGWTPTAGDLPDSTGLRVPGTLRSWGERVSVAVEEKSVRIVSECVVPFQGFDWGKNRMNVERVRRSLLRQISAPDPS